MIEGQPPGSVQLADKRSASTLLFDLVNGAVEHFPQGFGDFEIQGDAASFRKGYSTLLPHFEAARLASSHRYEIASYLVDKLNEQIVWQRDGSYQPLRQMLQNPVAPLPLNRHEFAGSPGWRPGVVYRGVRWEAARFGEFGAELAGRHVITAAAAEALSWIDQNLLQDGKLTLRGRKIAVMGAAAEMAPTRLWLQAGADVLWLDRVPPPDDWLSDQDLAGRLYWPQSNVDLLRGPREVLATLKEFAGSDKLDLGLYAYAPGQAREMRLTSTMNAIVDALDHDLIASVTTLVSPTTPTQLQQSDLDVMAERLRQRPMWEAWLGKSGLLGRGGGAARAGACAASLAVVPIQGASYQVAQYVGKVLAAEVWSARQKWRVSANTAAITRTRSLAHPVFTAAFGGAAAFRVETLTPRQSRCINGLLALHDWVAPAAPVPGAIRVHGAIHAMPYPLESALRIAAAIGFARSPRLLRGLFVR